MRAPTALLCLAALAGGAMPPAWRVHAQAPRSQARQDRPHFTSAVSLTTVNATVTDADGRLVRGLPREQFEVFEIGRAHV